LHHCRLYQNTCKKGAKGTIKITYNAAAVSAFNKTIVVTSNAKTPTKYLNIVGEVVAKARQAANKPASYKTNKQNLRHI
jgi:hypothetical protein